MLDLLRRLQTMPALTAMINIIVQDGGLADGLLHN